VDQLERTGAPNQPFAAGPPPLCVRRSRMKGRTITLLGRRDEPTDGREEYCSWLGQGLVPLGYELEAFRMRRADKAWRAAIDELRKRAVAQNGEALAVALARLLSDSLLRHVLAELSWLAQINYFSWPAIGARYAEALQGTSHLQ